MIDDPITLSDANSETIFDSLKYRTGPVMIFEAYGHPSQNAINCYMPNQEDPSKSHNLFGIHREFGNNQPCWIGDNSNDDGGEWVNYQQFIDFLMDKYPDYLEWFLFHPEWLGA